MNQNQEEEENFSIIPLNKRLTSPKWKARVSAYEEIKKIFDTTDLESSAFDEWGYILIHLFFQKILIL